MSTEITVVQEAPKKSNGQIFKERTGYSKTMAANIRKAKVSSIEEYRKVRASKRAERSKSKRAKHDKAKAGRITGKVKTGGGKKKDNKQDSSTQN